MYLIDAPQTVLLLPVGIVSLVLVFYKISKRSLILRPQRDLFPQATRVQTSYARCQRGGGACNTDELGHVSLLCAVIPVVGRYESQGLISNAPIFRVPTMDREDPGAEILLINRTCGLELSSCLCQAFVFTLCF